MGTTEHYHYHQSKRQLKLVVWLSEMSRSPRISMNSASLRASCTASRIIRHCWHWGHRCRASQGTGGGCRRKRMKTGAKPTFRNILRHYQNLPCSCRSNWKKYFGGNESIKKPMKGTLPVFADTFSKIALEVEPTLNISLLFFVQRYV